jgi:hypothetical protein
MGMFDEIKAEKVVTGPPCSVKIMIEKMSEQERKDFQLACDDPSIAGSVIARVLNRNGYDIKAQAIQRHTRGECRCE